MQRRSQIRVGDGAWTRRILIGLAAILALLLLAGPVLVVLHAALKAGFGALAQNLTTSDTLHAIWLTILTAIIVVPVNVVFGVCAAWATTRFEFPGRKLLMTMIDLPFAISPIVAGVAYLFVYGAQGLLGPWLQDHDIQVMFSLPAIFLASLFVTAPFVARELTPLMQAQGTDAEEAAISLGAPGFLMFFRVTLPRIKWALLYGVILLNARTMGEFGAVSVVSGSIRGQTNTLPLQVELLFNDYNTAGAFAAAAVLLLLALVTLVAKIALEHRVARADETPPAATPRDATQGAAA